MVKSEEFYRIKEIFEQIPELEVRTARGGKFKFPIYMTGSLANTPIDALELSVRSYNCLKRVGINTIGELCEKVRCSGELKSIRNCGNTSVAEIMDSLFAYQFAVLKPERRGKFLAKVIEMNMSVATK